MCLLAWLCLASRCFWRLSFCLRLNKAACDLPEMPCRALVMLALLRVRTELQLSKLLLRCCSWHVHARKPADSM